MTPTRDEVRIAAAGQAAEWFIANQDPALDATQRSAFMDWLRSSPIHIEEYFGIAQVARDLPAAAEISDEALEALLESADREASERVVPMPVSRVRQSTPPYVSSERRWMLAAAAVVAVGCVAWWLHADFNRAEPQRYATRHGEQSTRRLDDDSILILNTDSAVVVEFDERSRKVRMEAGQAYFTVAHDDSRRFRVVAGAAEIVAVGTQFDVRLQAASTIVTVIEGQVDVSSRAWPEGAGIRHLQAGYQLKIDGDGVPAQSERVDTEAAVAWLQHKIAFDNRPLGEVADEFNRYGAVRFVIADPHLRELRVSGVFNAYDTNSFAAFLESLDGVRLEHSASEIRVVRQDAGAPEESRPAN